MMKATIFGTRSVGPGADACLAGMNNDVVCMDIDTTKVECSTRDEITIFEPSQQAIVTHNHLLGQLAFTTEAAAMAHREIIFIAAETSPDERGRL